jgi:hypothetical protein
VAVEVVTAEGDGIMSMTGRMIMRRRRRRREGGAVYQTPFFPLLLLLVLLLIIILLLLLYHRHCRHHQHEECRPWLAQLAPSHPLLLLLPAPALTPWCTGEMMMTTHHRSTVMPSLVSRGSRRRNRRRGRRRTRRSRTRTRTRTRRRRRRRRRGQAAEEAEEARPPAVLPSLLAVAIAQVRPFYLYPPPPPLRELWGSFWKRSRRITGRRGGWQLWCRVTPTPAR